MISKLFKLSYLTARAPAKSHVQFRLCLRKNKQYNGSHVQFHDCQVSSSITQRHSIFYFNVRTEGLSPQTQTGVADRAAWLIVPQETVFQ